MGPLAVDMYLRLLLAIDSEVVDREIVHTPEVSCYSIKKHICFGKIFAILTHLPHIAIGYKCVISVNIEITVRALLYTLSTAFSLSFEVEGSDQKVEGRGVWGPSPNRSTGGQRPCWGAQGGEAPQPKTILENLWTPWMGSP